jgi:hypothetical protein
MGLLDMKTKRALTNVTAKRYSNASRPGKTKLPGEFVGR